MFIIDLTDNDGNIICVNMDNVVYFGDATQVSEANNLCHGFVRGIDGYTVYVRETRREITEIMDALCDCEEEDEDGGVSEDWR